MANGSEDLLEFYVNSQPELFLSWLERQTDDHTPIRDEEGNTIVLSPGRRDTLRKNRFSITGVMDKPSEPPSEPPTLPLWDVIRFDVFVIAETRLHVVARLRYTFASAIFVELLTKLKVAYPEAYEHHETKEQLCYLPTDRGRETKLRSRLQQRILEIVQELRNDPDSDYENPPDEIVASQLGSNARGQPYTRNTVNRARNEMRRSGYDV